MSYVNVSTTSKNKLDVTRWAKSLTSVVEGYALYLVGCSDGWSRHVEYVTSLGIPERLHVVVERDYDTFVKLIEMAKALGFKGKVLHGDLLEVASSYKGQVGYIDYDGVDAMTLENFMYCEELLKLMPDALHLTFPARNGGFINELSDAVGLPHNTKKMVYDREQKKYVRRSGQRPFTDEILKTAILRYWPHAKLFEIHSRRYSGRSNKTPMVCVVLQLK